MKVLRKILQIEEDHCNGCGNCILDCMENAIEIVNGKARVKSENLCDGLGACIGSCPTGALSLIERECDAYDEHEVERLAAQKQQSTPQKKLATHCGCPSAMAQIFEPKQNVSTKNVAGPGHWPLKIRLVSPTASFFQGACLVIAADCACAVSPSFHDKYANGNPLIIGCPKFDDVEAMIQKFTEIFMYSGIAECTVVRMEVPCCSGIVYAVSEAVKRSGTQVPVQEHIVSIRG